MNGIVAWFARNGVAANLLMILSVVGGIIAFFSLEREIFPAADFNGATVSIVWEGASPNDIEEQIVTRLEETLADIDGLKRITGTANEGQGSVNLEAQNDIDIDVFVDEVERRVNQINNLPQAAFEPQVNRWRAQDEYIGVVIYGDVDRLTLKRVADRVRDEIALLPGGELAQVGAVLDEEVSIEISEEELRRYNLTFSEVADAIRGSSINSSGGFIRSQTGNVSIQTRRLADTEKQFGDIIIRQSVDGGAIRVRDVATVIDGFVDANLDSTYNGKPSAFIFIQAPETMDIVRYAENIREYVDAANARIENTILPEALALTLLWDGSEIFQGRMDTITNSAGLGLILVLIVLLLFLRPLVAFWVTVGIITAFAGGIMLLPLFDVSFNILSLFAVLLVIGVVVDDAIVVGENIHKEVESGRREGLDAATVGTQLVMKPVIFGVITTMIMFSPWMLLSGPERQFTAQISYVVIAALSFSLIESMLILPSHLAHMRPQEFTGVSGGFMKFQRRIADSLLWFANNVYKPLLEAAVHYRYATVAFFVSVFLIANQLITSGIVPFRIMPEIEDDLVRVTIDMPDGTPFERNLQIRDQLLAGVEQARREFEEIYPDLVGDDTVVADASIVAFDANVRAWIGTLPPERRPEGLSTGQIAERIRNATGAIPDAEEISFDFTINSANNSIRFALNGEDLDRLRAAAEDLKAQLSSYGSTYDIGDNLSSAAEEIRLTMKPGAETLGLTLADVSRQVRQAYFGELAQRLPRNGEDIRVMVRLPEADRRSLDSLRQLRIRTPDGRAIPLDEVAEIDFAPGVNRILRRERTRSVAVFAQLTGNTRQQISADLAENFWPSFEQRFPDISRGAIGEQESEQEFLREITLLFVSALVMMYTLLAIAFRSYAQPLLIMTAIPFGYAGAAFGLLFFDTSMALFSLFGIGAAAGVVINDNLVLIDYVNRRRAEGAGAVQALVDAGVSRFRPVLLTSVTTFVGILPMITEKSIQAQFLRPMVISLGSAVAFALFVSLLFVPALYAVGVEIGRFFKWSWSGRPYRTIGEGYSGVANVDEEELLHRGDRPPPAPAE